MKTLDGKAIFSQLDPKEDYRVIACVRVGENPVLALLKPNFTWVTAGPNMGEIVEHMNRNITGKARVLLLCDLYVEGNEPDAGIVWDKPSRVDGAILGLMSGLMLLLRHSDFRELLFQSPERIILGVMDEGRLRLLEKETLKMIEFIRSKMTRGHRERTKI